MLIVRVAVPSLRTRKVRVTGVPRCGALPKSVPSDVLGVKSPDKAIEVQSEYAKTAYEGYVTHASKLGELYTNLAKEAFKPYEGLLRK